MAFTEDEKTALLAVKGVGETVIARLEQIGVDSFQTLSQCNATEIAERVALMLKSTCWKNSSQAKTAINAAVARAKAGLSDAQ